MVISTGDERIIEHIPVKVDYHSQSLPSSLASSRTMVTSNGNDSDKRIIEPAPVKVEYCSQLLPSPLVSSHAMVTSNSNNSDESTIEPTPVKVDYRSQLLPSPLAAPQFTRTNANKEASTPQTTYPKSEPEPASLEVPLIPSIPPHAMVVSNGERKIIESIRALIDEERVEQMEQIARIEGVRDVLCLELKHREQYIFELRQLLSDKGVTPPALPILESQKYLLHT
ncbi:hypothetical protein F5880DRAFT_1558046 [Lentinula raphanica]|nr:hypothetical protein F5880DRAFT_1558046 [Lentinula raphanica]